MVGISSAKALRRVLINLCKIAPDMNYWQNELLIELPLWGEALMDEGAEQ